MVYLQNHDQVGNRAQGDRFHQQASPDLQAAAAPLYLLSAFTPMLFMGEEWATTSPFPFFSDHAGDLGQAVSEGRRREFAAMAWQGEVPDPQSPQTRTRAVLDWQHRDQPEHARMFEWYRTLIALRRSEPGVMDAALGSVEVQIVDVDTV